MKFRNLFWGVLLVTIGLMFVLRNFEIIDFSWRSFLGLWPMLLILWGVSILPVKDLFKVVLAFLIITGSVIYVVQDTQYNHWEFNAFDHSYSSDQDEDFVEEDHQWKDQHFTESYDASVAKVVLDFEAAAGTFYISDTTSEMLDFSSRGTIGNYYMEARDEDSVRYINISHEENVHIKGPYKNNANLRLNILPIWDMDIDVGAAKMDMDLRPFKISKLDIDGGASSIKLRLGEQDINSRINIEAGMASIIIRIPESAGCHLETSNVLSSRNIKGFIRQEDDTFITPDFEESTQKIYVDIETAFSKFTIKRY